MDGRELGIRYTFYRATCNADCGPLQIIQVCYGTQHLDHDVGQPLDEFTALVDAGPNSPRRLYTGLAPGHPERPYFYTPHVHRVEFKGDRLRLVDIVGAARRHERLFLEASAVCIQHGGSNQDSVVQTLSYGWNNFGHEHLPHPDAQPGVLFEVRDHVSDRFKEIVEREYADYAQNYIQW